MCKIDLPAYVAVATEPCTKPIDTTPVIIGAAEIIYADATMVGETCP